MNEYDNCKAKIYINNIAKEQDEIKEYVERNITKLYDKSDEHTKAINLVGEKLNNKLSGIFIGLFSSFFILLISIIITWVVK